jgi:hypothetical protein
MVDLSEKKLQKNQNVLIEWVFSRNTEVFMAFAKHWKDVIVFLLLQEYIKLEIQENPGWETFISGKKKCKICLFLSFNGSNCAFLTTRLKRAEMYLKCHSNDYKSKKYRVTQNI